MSEEEKNEFWCYEPHEVKYELLDPGVRETVRFLIAKGFHTVDSGDGESKRAKGWTEEDGMIPFPHVMIEARPDDLVVECRRLVSVLKKAGIEVASQTEAWMEVIEEHGELLDDGPDVKPRPYIEATYDPVNGRAIIGLYYATSEMFGG